MSLTVEQRDLRDAVRGLIAKTDDRRAPPGRRLCDEIGVAGTRDPRSATAAPAPGWPRPASSWRNSAGT